MKTWIVTLVLLAAAILEVGGDAIVRTGLRGRGSAMVAPGFVPPRAIARRRSA